MTTTILNGLTGIIIFLLYSTGYPADCTTNGNNWPATRSSAVPSARFILAMGANTGKLKYSEKDASDFAEALQARLSEPVYVCKILKVYPYEFANALKQLANLAQPQDEVFIYFSGHGRQQRDNSKDETDCYDEVLVTAYSHDPNTENIKDDKLVKLITGIKAERITTVIDTCFASGMLRAKGCGRLKSKYDSQYSEVFDPSLPLCQNESFQSLPGLPGILYAAAQEGEDAFEIKGEGGLFTQKFLAYLTSQPNTLKLETALEKAFAETVNELASSDYENCRQHPQQWLNGSEVKVETSERHTGAGTP